MPTLYIVALDRTRLGDALFLQSLAQHIQKAMPGAPTCLFIHGSGEKLDRTLEAQGIFPERTDEGLLQVDRPEEAQLVERAVREMNQSIVGTLTDEVVPAVGIQGVDRGLLRTEDGTVTTGGLGWLEALLKQHVLPVVSALVPGGDSPYAREVPLADAVLALANGLSDAFTCRPTVFTTTGHAGLMDATGTPTEATLDAVSPDAVPAHAVVSRAVAHDYAPLVTSPGGLFGSDEPSGTTLHA
mgnify:CR=1 FL=1